MEEVLNTDVKEKILGEESRNGDTNRSKNGDES
jgi:hypothetical protein